MSDSSNTPTIDDTLPGAGPGDTELVGDADRYLEEGMIGRGGMGVVSSYFDRRIGRRIARKELRRDVDDTTTLRARFLREARVQGQLEHPAIVPVYDLGIGPDGAPFFTMRTVRGTTLADILFAGEMPTHRLLTAFARVCLAIDYAHSQRVLHRDLKPANLILGEYGEVYVLDWGLAKILGDRPSVHDLAAASRPDETNADSLLGTPGYMAPEQIADPSNVGPAADVYALGAILFEILSRVPLHERGFEALDSTRRGVEARISKRAPTRDVDPELEALVVRATALDPRKRPSVRDVADAIERYLEGERDLELRKAKAAEHLRIAKQALTNAGDRELDARRAAMNELNHALVLDPANAQARAEMMDLLTSAPDTTPPEVASEIERHRHAELRWVAKIAACVYFSLLSFIAILWWMGIREIVPLVGFFSLIAVSGLFAAAVSRSRQPKMPTVTLAVVASVVAFGFASRFTSPLVVVPAAVAINAAGFAVFAPFRLRMLVMLLSCASFIGPMVLELTGVLAPTFRFTGGHIEILPLAINLPEGPTLLLFVLGSTTSVFLGVVIMGYIRDRLARAERRIVMFSWQLRELLPKDVRTQTDPMKFTAKRKGTPTPVPDIHRP